MKTTFFTASIVAASLVAAVPALRADDYNKTTMKDKDSAHHMDKSMSMGMEKSANEIIGQKVVNAQNEDLGKIHDLIVNVNSGDVPFAVVNTGGLLDRTKVAVPLSSLRCSADGKAVVLSATKEELQAASKTPTGTWMPVANSGWAKNVDGFYGQPMAREHTMRDAMRNNDDNTRTYVRDPAPKGAELLATQDAALCQKVSDKVDALQVQVQNGTVMLYGQVESEAARQKLENQIRSVDGVLKVESHLRVKNP